MHVRVDATTADPTAATDQIIGGDGIATYVYDPYGRHVVVRPGLNGVLNFGLDDQFTTASAYGNVVLYTGQRYDTETGLDYYGARYNDANAGRFIGRDPIGVWGDGINLGNPYAYVGNMPMDLRDPSGMCPWCIVTGAVGFVVGTGVGVYKNGDRLKEDPRNWRAWASVGGYALAGTAAGALVGTGVGASAAATAWAVGAGWSAGGGVALGVGTSVAIGAVAGAVNSALPQWIDMSLGFQCGFDYESLGWSIGAGAALGLISGGAGASLALRGATQSSTFGASELAMEAYLAYGQLGLLGVTMFGHPAKFLGVAVTMEFGGAILAYYASNFAPWLGGMPCT